jgi:hypothetical protein
MQAVVREVIDEQFRAHSASSQGPESGDLHSAVHGTSGAPEFRTLDSVKCLI